MRQIDQLSPTCFASIRKSETHGERPGSHPRTRAEILYATSIVFRPSCKTWKRCINQAADFACQSYSMYARPKSVCIERQVIPMTCERCMQSLLSCRHQSSKRATVCHFLYRDLSCARVRKTAKLLLQCPASRKQARERPFTAPFSGICNGPDWLQIVSYRKRFGYKNRSRFAGSLASRALHRSGALTPIRSSDSEAHHSCESVTRLPQQDSPSFYGCQLL